jgi:hypothetical protein
VARDIDVCAIQQQLVHAQLNVTANYLRGVAPVEILQPIGRRRAPMMAVPSFGDGSALRVICRYA